MSDHFKMDGLEILAMRAAKGEIRRRDFVKGAALLMATPLALRATTAFAADNLVVANWGGDALTAYKDAFADVFNKTAGMGLTIDGSGPTEGAGRDLSGPLCRRRHHALVRLCAGAGLPVHPTRGPFWRARDRKGLTCPIPISPCPLTPRRWTGGFPC